jgi:hypothetical protein
MYGTNEIVHIYICINILGVNDGPMPCMALMKLYWVLSHQVRMSCFYQIRGEIDTDNDKEISTYAYDHVITKELSERITKEDDRSYRQSGDINSSFVKIGKQFMYMYLYLYLHIYVYICIYM